MGFGPKISRIRAKTEQHLHAVVTHDDALTASTKGYKITSTKVTLEQSRGVSGHDTPAERASKAKLSVSGTKSIPAANCAHSGPISAANGTN